MKRLCLFLFLLVTPTVARAELVTPNFTQGSMQSTTTTTQTVTETIEHELFGSSYSKWTGENITPSSHLEDSATTFSVTTAGDPFTLEITERAAGAVIETIDIDRSITTNATTTSLSVFSQ